MNKTFAERAQIRKRTWVGGIASSFDELSKKNIEFWRGTTASDRFNAVWEMAFDYLMIRGDNGSTPRLSRSVGGIRRQ